MLRVLILGDILLAVVVYTQITFVAGPPSAATSMMLSSNTNVTADGLANTSISILLRDVFINPVPNAIVSFTDSAVHASFGSSPCITGLNGVCASTLSSTDVGVHTVRATVQGVLMGQTQVPFVAGAPSPPTSTFQVDIPVQTVGVSAGMTATLLLQDASGHGIGASPTTFSTSSPTLNITASAATNAQGIATATLTTTQAQNANVTVTAGGLLWTAAVTFTAGPPDANTSTLSVVPASLWADGNSTAVIIVTSRDTFGNAVSGAPIAISASGSANAFASLVGTSSTSGTWSTTLSSTQVQTETVMASLGANITLSAPVTFRAGSPSPLTSSLSAAPAVQTADGNKTIAATLTLRDSWAHPLAGFVPSFSVSGSLTTLAAWFATRANGQSSTALKTPLAQSQNVFVAAGGINLATPVRFAPGAAAAINSWITASPNTLVADGNANTVLSARLADINNNVITGQGVAFSASGNPATWASVEAVTNAQGVASTTVSALFSGPRRAFAQAQNLTLNTNVKWSARTAPVCLANPNFALVKISPAAPFGALSVADFNNDGRSDIAVASRSQITLYWGTSSGFATQGTTLAAAGAPTALASADLNGDGFADMISLNAGGTLNVLLNLGTTSFASPVAYSLNANGQVLAIDDFNGDAQLDVAVALTNATNAAAVLLGVGAGQLGNATYWPAAGPSYGLTTIDFNQDGIRDIAITNNSGNTVLPVLGAGDGTFALQSVVAAGTGPKDVCAGDFNQDGIDDLMVLDVATNTVGVLLGSGNVTFRTLLSFGVGTAPSSLALDDLNGDSLPDIITLSATDKSYSVLLGAANGTFALRIIYLVDAGPALLATGDFNHDGFRDVLVANGNGQA